jgi:NAD(P)-dependent dehydrogenase (short-subunit alcohol dehydrogenase family)
MLAATLTRLWDLLAAVAVEGDLFGANALWHLPASGQPPRAAGSGPFRLQPRRGGRDGPPLAAGSRGKPEQRFAVVGGDVSRATDRQVIVAATLAELGGLDALVSNAGSSDWS